jgi:hypothetical protein
MHDQTKINLSACAHDPRPIAIRARTWTVRIRIQLQVAAPCMHQSALHARTLIAPDMHMHGVWPRIENRDSDSSSDRVLILNFILNCIGEL